MIDEVSPAVSATDAAASGGGGFQPDAWRGDVERHRVGRTRDGRWWWVHPEQGALFVAGLAGVERTVGSQPAISQVRGWGFNLLVPPVADGFCSRGLPHLVALDLARAGDCVIRHCGVVLPDVFDQRWTEAVTQRAGVVTATAGVAGYLVDQDLRWGGDAVAGEPLPRPALLQVCLSLDPTHAAYHAAWEFVLATRPGGLSDLVRDWGIRLPNKESLRQQTADDVVIDTPGFRVDQDRFLREFSQRYHRTVSEAMRVADASRMWLCAPLTPATPAIVRANAASLAGVVPVTAPGLGGGRAPELLWQVDGVDWGRQRRAVDPVAMSALERQLARTRETLLAWCEQPQVVGYVWARHAGGDLSADGPASTALVDDNGRVNEARVAPLAAFNAKATAVRSAVGSSEV